MSRESFDPDEVNRLRIALGRIARRVSRPAGDGSLTPSQASLLGTVARRKTIGVRELADLEGLNPTMCSRMLGKLEDAGLVSRSSDATTNASSSPTSPRTALHSPKNSGSDAQPCSPNTSPN